MTEDPQAAEEQKTPAAATEEKEQVEKPAEPQLVEIDSAELENLKAELADHKDKYWRLLAESENQRKRMQKERQEYVSYAVKNALLEILQPLDNLDHALSFTDQMSEEVSNWAMGFQMILTQFKDALANQNIKSFSSLHQHFDPHLHEAVETLETEEHPDGTILQEFVKGYKMGDRVIRPARVKVAKGPKTRAEETEGQVTEEVEEQKQGE